ncbi:MULTISPECIES: inner membrane protein YpjD [Burkholderiaceae]|uniref:cytochrome C assembly family protein n=1 Tax=Burkholderiaceae TaxID=119060 RepID=UPI0009691232|nr:MULTISPECIES: cytochrome c biogenesis protein CcsA [Burkholderiaceae]MCG1017491.1 cytochrome c biogenesis protein CcsA [Mycetohabitans sp. B4]SIT69197.1 ABC-type uncharacterized transport system, permease component [Burkholderia sp. b13]
MHIVLYAFTALLYGSLGIAAWRSHRHVRDPHGTLLAAAPVAALPAASGRGAGNGTSPVARAVLFAALVLHGVLLHMTIFPADAMVFGFAFALSAMLWLGAGIYWIESFFFRLDGLRLLLMPIACVATLLPLLFGGIHVLAYAADPLFKVHFVLANVAYGLLAIAALHAILMLLVERRLHALRGVAGRRTPGPPARDWLSSWFDTLPPLLTLEKLLFRLITAGFVLLTLALISGVWFSEQLIAQAVKLDHKTVFAFVSWIMFGALLVGRHRRGWRGRTALRWVLASFAALLFAYVGSRFVLEVLLHRAVV